MTHTIFKVRDGEGNMFPHKFSTPAQAIKFAKAENARLDPNDFNSHECTIELQY